MDWKDSFENDQFLPTDNGTLLKVELDSHDDFASYFDEHWPKALEELKKICENKKA